MRNQIPMTVAVFVGLAVIYAVLIFAARSIADPFSQTVMVSTGSAIFGGGLAFFLIRLFQITEEHH